ncbi:(deoxy)nucleoside triphosphate pyrophosphohydrolase [Desulfuromonas carbonis]
MKTIDVSCAIIEKDGLVLAAQRSESMSLPLKWEFPGGKLHPHEDAATCLKREIEEELGIGIHIKDSLPPSDWQYPAFGITLHPFICTMNSDVIVLTEHKAVAWVVPVKLPSLDWADADIPVLQNYLKYLVSSCKS